MALGCTLTIDFFFGLLLLLYLALALPLLALAQLDRARVRAEIPAEEFPVPRLTARITAWSISVLLLGLCLFLLTPRLSWESWDPFQQLGVRSGKNANSRVDLAETIDLNRTGTVNLGQGEAFTVQVMATGLDRPSPLPPDVHWRTGLLNVYQDGNWRWQPTGFPLRPPPQMDLPDLGPDSTTLLFQVSPREAGGLPLAEPILFGNPQRRTVQFLKGRYPFVENEGTLLAASVPDTSHVYQQVTRLGLTRWPLLFPPPLPGDREERNLIRHLTQSPLPELAGWTRELLQKLAQERRFGLTPDHLPTWPHPAEEVPPHAEVLARGLTAYLARSGEFTYTLDLRREEATLDPTLDFLWHVRQGHCERYASALTLMLRSQGIPARIVRGFRGGERHGVDSYVISQQRAHAWVEAIVPARQGTGYDWITLEPTPDVEAPTPDGKWDLGDLWRRFSAWQETLWRDLIVGYNANQQTVIWKSWLFSTEAARFFLATGVAIVVVVLVLILARHLWFRWKRLRTSQTWVSLPVLNRLGKLLQRHRLVQLDPERTPLEIASAAQVALASRAHTASHADLPGWLVRLFYRDRFGGIPLTAEELEQATTRVEALAQALASPPSPVSAAVPAPG